MDIPRLTQKLVLRHIALKGLPNTYAKLVLEANLDNHLTLRFYRQRLSRLAACRPTQKIREENDEETTCLVETFVYSKKLSRFLRTIRLAKFGFPL